MHLLIRFLVNAVALYLIAKYVPGFSEMSVGTALIAAVVFGIVNAIIGPILRFVTFPITWLTHGLFSIVVNYILFWLTVFFTPNFSATGVGGLPRWEVYLIGAVIMTIVSTIVQQLSKSDAERAAESTS
jgi:putative membrane protein